jgi:hypothetical protein
MDKGRGGSRSKTKKGVRGMEMRGKEIKHGIKIKTVGLELEEMELIENALRKIKRGRRRKNLPPLSYIWKLQ